MSKTNAQNRKKWINLKTPQPYLRLTTELIENEIMDSGTPVQWDEIAGLEFVKKTVKEIVVFFVVLFSPFWSFYFFVIFGPVWSF